MANIKCNAGIAINPKLDINIAAGDKFPLIRRFTTEIANIKKLTPMLTGFLNNHNSDEPNLVGFKCA